MKNKIIVIAMACAMALAIGIMAGCSSSSSSSAASASGSASASAASASAPAASASASAASASSSAAAAIALDNGTYTADFNTDSTMFHVNEAYEGKVTLTVKDGKATAHLVTASTSIVGLYLGKVEDAEKDGAAVINATTEEVKYKDGTTDKASAFDVPVPVLDEPFDLAIIGTKGKWYDHVVSVTNVQPAQ